VETDDRRVCEGCGTALSEDSEFCPICAFRGAISHETEPLPDASSELGSDSELRFDHYQVLKNEDGTPIELGHGGMGTTYKAFDVHLECPVALKIINARYLGDTLTRQRFVREARAAASVRHPNVATVLHLGENGGNYFYAMEFVEGETLENIIRECSKLEPDLALEVVTQVASGLTGIERKHLIHRDIKPSNIMVSFEQDRLETVKIIDLGLAKRVAQQDTISIPGSFVGTPAYASPEQFAGMETDIRSDLYSLGVTLWEMVSGGLPFQCSAAELMYQHQHLAPPFGKLKDVSAPIITLLQVLLEKDPGQRFQTPAQLRQALPKVREAISANSRLTPDELRRAGNQTTDEWPKPGPRKTALGWRDKPMVLAASIVSLLLAAFFFYSYRGLIFKPPGGETLSTEKSIAVLPFESLSDNKDDSYFADGVQDEILNDLAKIGQLKVISRTSVMQYRAETKRNLRQIASALGVAKVLEGTVRREGNHVRVSTELIDARNDTTIWADSYDRDLIDIFEIQSAIAQTIAGKLAATLSPEEKRNIERKPTENLEAYDLYLRAKELLVSAEVVEAIGAVQKQLVNASGLLDHAIELDPKFTLAYCKLTETHDAIYLLYDSSPEQRALGDAAISRALSLEPDLPEVRLTYARHLLRGYHDDDRALQQLKIAERGLPNNAEAFAVGANIDRQQGHWEKAIQGFKNAIARDPRNSVFVNSLALTLSETRQFRASEQTYDRAIELRPDEPLLKLEKLWFVNYYETGDDTAYRTAVAALPVYKADDRTMLNLQMSLAFVDHNWTQAKELIQRMNGGDDEGEFSYAPISVPVGCYSILLARLQRQPTGSNPSFAETRTQLNQMVQKAPEDALLLSQLAVVDALLEKKEDAIAEAKRAVELLPISKDAVNGPGQELNLAVVYAWTGELDLAFETLSPLAKVPNGIFYGQLKSDPCWEPLRQDPRFEELLAELASSA
jgi:serine/threonine protein kinase/Flp pilus assembly protein TadD